MSEASPLNRADARQDQPIDHARDFDPNAWPRLIRAPHSERDFSGGACAYPAIRTSKASSLRRTIDTLRGRRLTPPQPCGKGVGDPNGGKFGKLYLKLCGGHPWTRSQVLHGDDWSRIHPLIHHDRRDTRLSFTSKDRCRDRACAAMARQQ